MAWYDTKEAAPDPDNPTATQQFPYSEHNAMVAYLKDKISNHAVDAGAIGDNKILVYKVATGTFVYEAQNEITALNDIPDVVISGVPADDEVVAYDSGTSKFINQTAAEASLATTTQLTTLETAAVLNADFNATTFLYAALDSTPQPKTPAETLAILSGTAAAEFSFNTKQVGGIVDPTTAQQAATKNYDDTHLFTKEVVTDFTNDYVPIYKTASGKFEMEEQSAALGLPVADTTAIVKSDTDGDARMRFEVGGVSTGHTRVMTIQDRDMTLCGTDEVMLLNGANAMSADLDMGGHNLIDTATIKAQLSTSQLYLIGGISAFDPAITLFGKDNALYPGRIVFNVPNASKTTTLMAMGVLGSTDTPIVDIFYGLDMNDKTIVDMKNSAPTALSGTQKDIEIDIGGTPYYFTVYPTKA